MLARKAVEYLASILALIACVASFIPPSRTFAQNRTDQELARQEQQLADLRQANLPDRMTKVEAAIEQIRDRLTEFTWTIRTIAAAAIAELVRRLLARRNPEKEVTSEDPHRKRHRE